MTLAGLLALATRDLRQQRARALIAALGIALGVTVLVVIAGLGLGVRERVLGEVVRRLPVDVVEVVPKTLDLGFFKIGAGSLLGDGPKLDPQTMARLQTLPEVAAVYPKLEVKLPLGAQGGAGLFGRRLYTDLFMTGLPVELVQPEAGAAFREGDGTVPVVISEQLIEVYNGSVAPSLGTPKLTPAALTGFEFDLVVGRSLMLGSRGAVRTGVERARIVGVSRYAMRLGVTVPLETARRLLATYGEPGPEQFAALVVRAKSAADVPAVTAAVRALGFEVDESAARVSDLITAATLLATLVGLLILALASLNIAHSFFAALAERRRELAILRAVGARRLDLVLLVVTQAALLGALGAAFGLVVARLLAWAGDWAASVYLPDFPFKPEAFFYLPPRLYVAGFALAVVASVLGALWPALRATRLGVARALTE